MNTNIFVYQNFTEYEYEYIHVQRSSMTSILGGLVTHTKSIQFQIFIEKYFNN
jgi:hypothetical protein